MSHKHNEKKGSFLIAILMLHDALFGTQEGTSMKREVCGLSGMPDPTFGLLRVTIFRHVEADEKRMISKQYNNLNK